MSLSLFNAQSEVSLQTSETDRIELFIPRDPSAEIPPMYLQNVTALNGTPQALLFSYHWMNLTMNYSFSVHIQMKPTSANASYLLVFRFDRMPQLNSSTTNLDGWSVFCPSNESLYEYFLDNDRTKGHRSLIIGLRELNTSESTDLCLNSSSNKRLPRSDQPVQFTSNYFLRFYTSGCYYLDANQQWQSDGLVVISFSFLSLIISF